MVLTLTNWLMLCFVSLQSISQGRFWRFRDRKSVLAMKSPRGHLTAHRLVALLVRDERCLP